MNDFLKAKSMATPGVAGALVTVLTTTLAANFGAPAKWTALVLSFLCGLLVFTDKSVGPAIRVGFYVLNSLIIFSTAFGTNGLAVAEGQHVESERAAEVQPAQPVPTPLPEVTAVHTGALVTVTPAPPAVTHPVKSERFFRPWLNESAKRVQRLVVTPTQ
jgi:hypothetical protein